MKVSWRKDGQSKDKVKQGRAWWCLAEERMAQACWIPIANVNLKEGEGKTNKKQPGQNLV